MNSISDYIVSSSLLFWQDVATKTNASQRLSLPISSQDSNKDGVIDHPRPNHRKNRQAPKPPIQQPKSLDEGALDNMVESTSNLEIRAPSELLLGFPTGCIRTQWRHSAEVLITGSVKYEVNVRINNKFQIDICF